jgi:hypothetical protein
MPAEFSLDQVRIASPCNVGWTNMRGDDRVRFCDHCRKNVYNLSAMTKQEAEALLKEKEGRLCISIFRRKDGTILTADCPVGLRLARRAAIRSVAAVASVIGILLAVAARFGLTDQTDVQVRELEPFARVTQWLKTTQTLQGSPLRLGDRSDGVLVP